MKSDGAVPERSFSERQVLALVHHILGAYGDVVSKILLSVRSTDSRAILSDALGKQGKITWVCGLPIASLLQCVRESDLVITPDTGIAHLDAAPNGRKLIFYADNYFNPVAWGAPGFVCAAIPSERQIALSDIPDEQLKYYTDRLFGHA